MDKYQAFAELISDEEKAKEIISDSIEETQKNLKANGLDFTIEELMEMAQGVAVVGEGELSEDSLGDVAGGIAFETLCGIALGCYAISAFAGTAKSWLNYKYGKKK